MKRTAAHVAMLTAVWVLLWGRLSVANVLTGVMVSLALLAVFPLENRRRDGPVVMRPMAVLRLVCHFAGQLVASNLDMAWQIVRPHPGFTTGVVVCSLHTRSPGLITMITNILALSPGMMAVDVIGPSSAPDAPPPSISVHVLRLDDPAVVRRRVARLERSVVDAFGARDEVDACAATDPAIGVST